MNTCIASYMYINTIRFKMFTMQITFTYLTQMLANYNTWIITIAGRMKFINQDIDKLNVRKLLQLSLRSVED